MRLLILLFVTAQLALSQTPAAPAGQTRPNSASERTAQTTDRQNAGVALLSEKLKHVSASGHVQLIGESSTARLQPSAPLAPGAPPILAFRYFDGQARHRFGDLDLVMDDAGH